MTTLRLWLAAFGRGERDDRIAAAKERIAEFRKEMAKADAKREAKKQAKRDARKRDK